MAEELNMQFSSVFTREDTSSSPVPETKFKGSEEETLGQLVVTPKCCNRGQIAERTYDWSQRSYDWSQESWVKCVCL